MHSPWVALPFLAVCSTMRNL